MGHAAFAHRAVGALPVGGLNRATSRGWQPVELRRAAELLYDGIERDRSLRAKFGSDLEGERVKLGALFVEVFAGVPDWSSGNTFGPLAQPHRHIHITRR